MSLVVNEAAVLAFVEALKQRRLPGDPDEYYFQIMTREKYGSFIGKILTRKVVHLDRLLDEIHSATPFRGFYENGKHIPHDSLVCYMTPEPRDVQRAMKHVCAEFILKEDEQSFRMPRAFYSECQKHPAQRRILDVDVDDPSKYPEVAQELETLGIIPAITIKSRGGYHVLCYDCGPVQNKGLYEMSKRIGSIDMLKNAMVPIPGTLQGGVEVQMLESEPR
jgi:hypothetical protein